MSLFLHAAVNEPKCEYSRPTSGPSGLIGYQSQLTAERDLPAATTEWPVEIWEGHTTEGPSDAFVRESSVVGHAVIALGWR